MLATKVAVCCGTFIIYNADFQLLSCCCFSGEIGDIHRKKFNRSDTIATFPPGGNFAGTADKSPKDSAPKHRKNNLTRILTGKGRGGGGGGHKSHRTLVSVEMDVTSMSMSSMSRSLSSDEGLKPNKSRSPSPKPPAAAGSVVSLDATSTNGTDSLRTSRVPSTQDLDTVGSSKSLLSSDDVTDEGDTSGIATRVDTSASSSHEEPPKADASASAV